MRVDPVLSSLLKDLRAGHFRPRAIRRFVRDGIGRAIDLAWSLQGLRRSFYAASAVMAAVLLAIGAGLEWALPGGLGNGTWAAAGAGFLAVFGLTLLQLGLVRAESSGEVYDRFSAPNVLTLLRLQVIPYLADGLASAAPGRPGAAVLALVLFAVATDTLDGFLSRRLGLTSDFGRIYDPVVDLVFHSAVAISLFTCGDVTAWYLATVLVRYLLPPVAGSFLYLFREPFQVKSTVMGKLSSLVLSAFLCFHAAGVGLDLPALSTAAHDWLEPASVAVCVVTTLAFLGRGVRILKRR